MNTRKWVAAGFTGACLALVAATAMLSVAEAQAPASTIATRKEAMKGNGAAAGALNRMVRGENPWNQQAAVTAATAINDTAKKIPALFPAGSGTGETNALPAIWEKNADFLAAAKKLEEASCNVLKAAQANDEAGVKAAFPTVGQACGGCHTPYRKPLT
ncbi:MAG: cytochrome c [Proteobacteria bacterium]|nr:cytochrome c [Pseudomonadota bacterium]